MSLRFATVVVVVKTVFLAGGSLIFCSSGVLQVIHKHLGNLAPTESAICVVLVESTVGLFVSFYF